jgi:ubiquinone biosynthesis accessory factor UbiJ
MQALERAAVATLNHLVARESWAQERLRRHPGQQAEIIAGTFRLRLGLGSEGLFETAAAGKEPAVTITLPDDFPAKMLVDRDQLFASARIAGSADFAETLAFVFRNLRWDAEDDLAAIVGDIPAHRLVQAGRQLVAWQAGALKNLAGNVSEYVVEEAHLVTPGRDIDLFARSVRELRDDVARLEKRIQHLGA